MMKSHVQPVLIMRDRNQIEVALLAAKRNRLSRVIYRNRIIIWHGKKITVLLLVAHLEIWIPRNRLLQSLVQILVIQFILKAHLVHLAWKSALPV